MKTLNLEEAAEFLKMHPVTLRRKANKGDVPGRKVGRAWVFIMEHLADFVSGRYPEPRRELRLIDGGKQQEENKCRSINAGKRGGFNSKPQTGKEYSSLLGLK
ncbi:helix-turn-helix domain-containing protein [Crenothrix polyspora]|uniref:DNA binding protein, excisionase family n=1 Tax=Crenothrix polyspora TaxID=360316 RepID=A0A1R4HFD4_9GAMM|nr:helix-turn-helix domain-containing protein [Crenothrix polyspora]SJM94965.1 DNA binding protein, excisionase family [Crenothrix polyspora]